MDKLTLEDIYLIEDIETGDYGAINEFYGSEEWYKKVVDKFNEVKGPSSVGRWVSVDEFLPPYEEEVIVLSDTINRKKLTEASCISYGHRPDPNGWSGRNIITGEVKHYEAKTYDGWNIPGVKYWMTCPKLKELE